MRKTVWINKNFAVIREYANALYEAGYRVIVSHQNADSPHFQGAGEHHIEPKGLSSEEYLTWALNFARQQQVDVFWPGKERRAMAAAADRFAEQGVHVIAAGTPEILNHLDDKAQFLTALPDFLPTPPWFVATTTEQLFAAADALTEQGWTPCIKPTHGVYGHGFRILVPSLKLKDFLEGDKLHMTFSEARALFSAAEPFAPMLVMGTLTGMERSVDVVCHEGQLGAAIIRTKKPGLHGTQFIERHPAIEDMTRRAVAHYHLSGVVNVQFKDDANGTPHILEINARPSGGSHMSALAGPNLAVWAVRLALGAAQPGDVPAPPYGQRLLNLHVATLVPTPVPA